MFGSPAVTTQPGLDILIGHELGVHVPTPCQHHHEEPGLLNFAGVVIDDLGTLTEVDLGRVPGRDRSPARPPDPVCSS